MNPLIFKKRNLSFHHHDLIKRYENLRSHVLRGLGFSSQPDMGYVLFLRRGVLFWMENCDPYILEPEVSKNSNNNDYKEIPDHLQKQLIFALTNIVINHQRRVYERI